MSLKYEPASVPQVEETVTLSEEQQAKP